MKIYYKSFHQYQVPEEIPPVTSADKAAGCEKYTYIYMIFQLNYLHQLLLFLSTLIEVRIHQKHFYRQ